MFSAVYPLGAISAFVIILPTLRGSLEPPMKLELTLLPDRIQA